MRSTGVINWTPTIGDPSVIGWVTVLLYFVTAALCAKVYADRRLYFSRKRRRQGYFWLSLSLVMFLLGVNKQLDLQSLFTEIARYLSHEQGWYQDRRYYQRLFVLLVLLSSVVVGGFLCFFYRKVYRNNLLAIAGICLLLGFVFIRASSFHHMDALINAFVVGIRVNWLFEVSGILMIAANAVWLHWQGFSRR